MSALAASNLTAGYAWQSVFEGLSISVADGEIVAVLGPNGTGKTTLFKCLAGLLVARAGTVELEDRHVGGLSAERRARAGLVLVPEGRRLFMGLSVRDNLQAGLFTSRAGPSIDDVLDRFPRLKGRMKQLAGSLSGGEQQMLAISRALLSGPRVLLIDEPSLGLAPLVVRTVFDALAELAGAGTSVVVAEQNVLEAARIADRCLVMIGGRIVDNLSSTTEEDQRRVSQVYAQHLDLHVNLDAGSVTT